MNTLGIICIIVALIIMLTLIPIIMEMDESEHQRKSLFITLAMGVAISCAMYFGGVIGAYNQMRGNYKITYKMDENKNVTDTIIHVR